MGENTTKSWWVSVDGQSTGPFTETEIRQRLADGEIHSQTYLCLVETDQWRELESWPEFRDSHPNSPPPPDHKQNPTKPAWNPQAIAWLGVLFTPAWSGIMAAINIKRLGLEQPLWRPLAIGVGSVAVSILYVCAGFDFGFLLETILFTIVPLIALWNADLALQAPAYETQKSTTQDHWIAPAFAGSPLALLTIVGWWLVLFGPLQPKQVVQRFWDAETTEEARKHITPNLYQMVDDIKRAEELTPELFEGDEGEIEWLSEYYAENDDHQYFVDYRMYAPPQADEPASILEGYFHLRWIGQQWKIENIWITHIDGQEREGGPLSFINFTQIILEEAQRLAQDKPKPPLKQGFAKWYGQLPPNTKRWLGIIAMLAALGAARTLFR